MKLNRDIALGAALYAGRRDFWSYCRLTAPAFYRPERKYLRFIAETLQALVEDRLTNDKGQKVDRLILNLAPRHGKTRTIINLCQWVLGRFSAWGIITASYNELLSSRMARAVRDGIAEKKADPGRLVYSDYFPGSKIKDGDSAVQLWALAGSHFSYLATSPGGTATGIGAKLLILDDIIKNADEAFNERVLEDHWEWYSNTLLSRLESGAKQIVLQTRWATADLTGRLLAHEPDKWFQITFPAYNKETGEMLAPDILSLEDYRDREAKTDPVIFQGNYQQEPFDSVDKLYPEFRTYTDRPKFKSIESYTDTADKGSDYLCSIVYGVTSDNLAYVLDMVYTQDGMEKTEPRVAAMLQANECEDAYIEANNGGEGFSRNVKNLLISGGYTRCHVVTFHQSGNKEARILTNATSVINCILFPEGWQYRWPKFHQDVTRMSRAGKWAHDDAADCLTGIVEKSISSGAVSFVF